MPIRYDFHDQPTGRGDTLTGHLNDVARVYTDGGCVLANPSAIGGSWAALFVFGDGADAYVSGHVAPWEIELPVVTNNFAELLAIVIALESLPDRWAGTVCTDSENAMYRVQTPHVDRPMPGVPAWLFRRLIAARGRMVRGFTVELHGGHPTAVDLARGFLINPRSGRSLPVSPYNVRVDDLCKARCRELHDLSVNAARTARTATSG